MICRRLIALLVCATAAAVAAADEDLDLDPQLVIEGRQAALREVGAAFKGIGDELRQTPAALASIREYVRQIDEHVKHQHRWFPPGSGPESEIETLAKPEIWTRPDAFKAEQAALSEHTAKLVGAARGEDQKAIAAQWRALGKTCKSCHDQFREEDE